MALKKQTAIRTGKMVRELMLGDKVVNASTVMVYSKDNVNEEIKIEKITPSSNEEIFSSEDIDWNKSVIYKIVDFVGNIEVGKVGLQDIKKSHITLNIERIMWKKEPNQEKVMVEADIASQVDNQVIENDNNVTSSPKIETIKPVQEEKVKLVQEEKVQAQEKRTTVEKVVDKSVEKSVSKAVENSVSKAVNNPVENSVSKAVNNPVENSVSKAANKPVEKMLSNNQNNENYQRLLHITMTICSNWDLGCDLDDSIDALKAELKQQGITSYFDEDTVKAIESIRTLKEKGIQLESLLQLL